jgi:hypothetical protein
LLASCARGAAVEQVQHGGGDTGQQDDLDAKDPNGLSGDTE